MTDIKKKAEGLYNANLSRIEYLMGHKVSTITRELINYGELLLGPKFKGVYPADRVPKLNHGDMVIVNLDKTGQQGSHWIAAVKYGDKLVVYDSFGRRGSQIIPSLKGSGNGKLSNTELDPEQIEKEFNCGQRSLAALLIYKNHGMTWYKHL